jgi:hypothetical protein
LSKSSLKKAKIANYFEVEDETCGRKKNGLLGTRTKSSVRKIATFLSIVINRDFWLRFLLHKQVGAPTVPSAVI